MFRHRILKFHHFLRNPQGGSFNLPAVQQQGDINLQPKLPAQNEQPAPNEQPAQNEQPVQNEQPAQNEQPVQNDQPGQQQNDQPQPGQNEQQGDENNTNQLPGQEGGSVNQINPPAVNPDAQETQNNEDGVVGDKEEMVDNGGETYI